METKDCIVARVDGDCARLNRTDAEEEPLFIARALLPGEDDRRFEESFRRLIESGLAEDLC